MILDSKLDSLIACGLLSVMLAGCSASDSASGEPVRSAPQALNAAPLNILRALPFEIVAAHSNKCLDVAGGLATGVDVQQYDCHNGSNQAWSIHGTSGRNFIAPYGTVLGWRQKMLNLASISSANNIAIQYLEYDDDQFFDMSLQPDGSFEIYTPTNTAGNPKCVDVAGASMDSGAAVQQYSCNNGSNQRWLVRPQRHPFSIERHSSNNGDCVDVAGADPGNNANIQQYPCTGGGNQLWYLSDVDWSSETPNFLLEAEFSGKCMDVADASASNNANIQQYECHGADNQRWILDSYLYGSGDFTDLVFRLRNKLSNKCADINGSNVRQYTCLTTSDGAGQTVPVASQRFKI